MPQKTKVEMPLGLPDQVDGLPTAPVDRGDETQDRFRYQWMVGAVLLVEAIAGKRPIVALWCEHHEDYLLELASGLFVAVQVKTVGGENAVWRVTDAAFIKSVKRFCNLEHANGHKIEAYEFCSNAPFYVPAATASLLGTLASSPERLIASCLAVSTPAEIAEPYRAAFNNLAKSADVESSTAFAVIRKLVFRLGPPLRGYMEWVVSAVVGSLPNVSTSSNNRLRLIRDELLRAVESASGVPTGGLDGGLAYLASDGRPEESLRGKCLTIEVVRTIVDQARQESFRYVECGAGLPLGHVAGQRDILFRKMQKAYLKGNFESIWMRALAAEQRMMARALMDAEGFDSYVNQLESAVLVECQDAEAQASAEPDERKRGVAILCDILGRLSQLASNEPHKVEQEPKETLVGVAGMLSGSCRFAWGIPLEESDDAI